MAEKNKGGKPRSYTQDDLRKAVRLLEARGEPVREKTIKPVLFAECGVSPTVRGEGLTQEIERLLETLEKERNNARIALVPAAAKQELAEMVKDLHNELLASAGRQHETLLAAAQVEVEQAAKREDALLSRIDDMKASAKRDAETIGKLSREQEAARKKLASLSQEVERLKAENNSLQAGVFKSDEIRELVRQVAVELSTQDQKTTPDTVGST